MITLPLYFFGADETTKWGSKTLTAKFAATMDQEHQDAFVAQVPIASFTPVHHSAVKFSSNFMILGPRAGKPAARFKAHKELDGTKGKKGFYTDSALRIT